MSAQASEGLAVLAAMATPVVLLLANAMLILSTNQRLQAILDRVRETELAISGRDLAPETRNPSMLLDLLARHAQRARAAHRALLCFYSSSGTFIIVVVLVGLAGLGAGWALPVALLTAFLGSAFLFCGAALLIRETWIGIAATDRRFRSVIQLCEDLVARAVGDVTDR